MQHLGLYKHLRLSVIHIQEVDYFVLPWLEVWLPSYEQPTTNIPN
jgi:hypothetical protein